MRHWNSALLFAVADCLNTSGHLYRSAPKTGELILVQDLTNGFDEHLKALGTEGLVRLAAFGIESAWSLKVGLVSFKDKPIWANGNDGRFHDYYDYCAKIEFEPSSTFDPIIDWYRRSFSQGGGDPNENQFGALMTAAQAMPTEDGNNKLLILMTDSAPHFEQDGSLLVPLPPFSGTVKVNDMDEQCTSEDYPHPVDVVTVLKSQSAQVLFMITDDSSPAGRVTEAWRWVNHLLGQDETHVVHLDRRASGFYELARGFLENALRPEPRPDDSTSTIEISTDESIPLTTQIQLTEATAPSDTVVVDTSIFDTTALETDADEIRVSDSTEETQYVNSAEGTYVSDSSDTWMDIPSVVPTDAYSEWNESTTAGLSATLPSLPISKPTLSPLGSDTFLAVSLPTADDRTQLCHRNCETATESAVKGLKACLQSTGAIFYTNDDPQYHVWNVPYNMQQSPGNPVAVVLPFTSKEVSASVQCGRQYEYSIIPRSRGHDYAGFTRGNTDAIVIDMRNMQARRFDADTGYAEVEVGNQLGVLQYYATTTANRFLPSGACTTLGIGGHVLGGGYGFYTRHYGLATEALTGVEVVLADGRIVIANTTHHQDLFWAMRGGGNGNFGAVTKLFFKLPEAPPVVTSASLYWLGSEFPSVMRAAAKFATVIDTRLSFSLTVTLVGVMLKSAYIGPLTGMLEALQPFLAEVSPPLAFYDEGTMLRSIAQLSIVDLLDAGDPVGIPTSNVAETRAVINAYLGGRDLVEGRDGSPGGRKVATESDLGNYVEPTRVYFRARSLLWTDSHPFNNESIALLTEAVTEANPLFGLAIELIGGNGSRLEESTSDSAWAWKDASWIAHWYARSYLPLPAWTVQHAAKVYDILSPNAGPAVYVNYHDEELENPLESYYGDNLDRLRRVKSLYDPDNVFNFTQVVLPA